MGNSESISNDLENIGNQIVNGVVDTGHQIADGGSTAINETANIINQGTEAITDAVIIPIVQEIDPGSVTTIRDKTRRPIKPPKVKPPPRPPKIDIKRDIITPIDQGIKNDIIIPIEQGIKNDIITPTNTIINTIDQGFQRDIIQGFQKDIIDGFKRDIIDEFKNKIIDPLQTISNTMNKKPTNPVIQPSEEIDDTTTYIIIGTIIAAAILLMKKK